MILPIKGRIDSANAAQVEQALQSQIAGQTDLVLDAQELTYISSAGLRLILHMRKDHPELRIIRVNPDIYQILEMTGFTEMMPVEKTCREVSLEGAEEIGRGANGTIYRIARDSVVKVYKHPEALESIRHEREMAKLALILGIPTAISYDVVKVGDSYGAVFELLNARSFAKILANEPEKLDWCVAEFAKMLRLIHGTEVPAGKLPDMKERALDWAAFMKDYLPKEAADKLYALVAAVPHDDHMLHGDYHTRNLELQNDEVLLIDMDTLSVGNPIFELGSMYNAFLGFSELDHSIVRKYQGFDRELSATFWQKSLAAYLGTSCPTKIREVEDKARVIGYTRMIRRAIRRDGLQTETGRAEIAHWKGELLELLRSTDTLLFDRNELEIEALRENLEEVLAFLGERLEAADCTPKARMQLELAVEEIFVNIASYAYNPETGKATVRVEVSGDPLHVTITFIDRGVPYDPLAKADPDLSASAQERTVGGLGIFLTKKLMDDVVYEYRGGRNVLTLKKNLE
jgi:uncharacterized protein (TIGR02172 family)